MIEPIAARWFEDRRGIKPETLEAFGVTAEGETIVYPYGAAKKYRKGLEAEGRKFWWDPPAASGSLPFLPPDFEGSNDWVILVEGETDTMATWQNLPDDLRSKVTVIGLSGVGAWEKTFREQSQRMDSVFGRVKRVFVVFDREDPYENPNGAAAVDTAWGKIRADLGRKARRVILPQGINDLAEFFQRYDWAALAVLLKKANEPVRHYPRLDLTQPVPDVKWVVENLLVGHESHVLAADGGTGKSWFCQALALAVAGGAETFLGLPVKRHGPVLYVDEEQSADLVLQRLNALGYDPEKHRDLEYISFGGVDLLNEPHLLLEEATEIEPTLIVIESLSEVSVGGDENDNSAMTQLMRHGIKPLARQSGAAVVITHHTTKDGNGVRGAGAIRNAVDQAISMKAAEGTNGAQTGNVIIFPNKSRRQGAHLSMRVSGNMNAGERVEVEIGSGVVTELPF